MVRRFAARFCSVSHDWRFAVCSRHGCLGRYGPRRCDYEFERWGLLPRRHGHHRYLVEVKGASPRLFAVRSGLDGGRNEHGTKYSRRGLSILSPNSVVREMDPRRDRLPSTLGGGGVCSTPFAYQVDGSGIGRMLWIPGDRGGDCSAEVEYPRPRLLSSQE